MNRTFTLCFLLYPIALPFGYVLVYTFYHYAVPDANSDLKLYNNPMAIKMTSANNKIIENCAYIANIAPKVYVCYGFIKTNSTIFRDENVFSISNLRIISSLLLYAAESNLFTPLLYRNGNMVVPNDTTLTSGYYYVCGTVVSE